MPSPPTHALRPATRRSLLAGLALAACLAALYAQCRDYALTQDDAYISLTYARNLAAGKGLVFNPGERVEGYTNFLWTALTALPHLVGVDPVAASRFLGLACAAASLVLAFRLGVPPGGGPDPLALLAPALLAANGALAVWTSSGLEPPLFMLLVTLGARQYRAELRADHPSSWTGLIFGLATLTRPDGAWLFGLTAAHRLALHARHDGLRAGDLARWTLPFALPVGAHLAFRLLYYGRALPNTFYAKTGSLALQLPAGLAYAGAFFVDYGFGGLLWLVPVALALRGTDRSWWSYVALLLSGWTAYVILVGGDALMAHRFFLPVLPLACVGLQEGVRSAGASLQSRFRRAALRTAGIALAAAALAATWGLARPGIQHERRAALSHNESLRRLTAFLNRRAAADTLVLATSTIGIPRYYGDAYVLDLVGLTDSTIARHPRPIRGIDAPFPYRKYNVQYVMDRRPDFIFFVTGIKPVHLAEKALFTSRRFRRDYYVTHIAADLPVFARRADAPAAAADTLHPDGAFVEHYVRGLNEMGHGSEPAAAGWFRRSIDAGPADFAAPWVWLGVMAYRAGDLDAAYEQLSRALALDAFAVEAQASMAALCLDLGRPTAALPHARRAVELSPRAQYHQLLWGAALVESGREVEALAPLQQALDLPGPRQADAAAYLGRALLARGLVEDARRIWESVLAAEPGHELSRRWLATLDGGGPSR